MARIYRVNSDPPARPSIYRVEAAPAPTDKTMDDVVNMDHVTNMDTLQEAS